jgi:predicted Zn-dependent protease with MMP-like domain
MHNKILQLNKECNKNNELEAFDNLPKELRQEINYSVVRLDARQVLGIYKQQGIQQAISFIAATQEV